MLLNAILGGDAGQTISSRAAVEAKARKPFWCVLCCFLSWLVQHDHCADQLAGIGMDDWQYARAFAGLLVLAALIAGTVHAVIFIVISVLHMSLSTIIRLA